MTKALCASVVSYSRVHSCTQSYISPTPAASSGPPVKDLESSGEADDQEHYVPMSPGEGNITSDDSDSEEENRYVPMFPVNVEE